MIGPEGKELPAGRGTAKEGAVVFAKRCEACQGRMGKTGCSDVLYWAVPASLIAGLSTLRKRTAWDYINRAMPAPKPGSLTHGDVYAVVAFLLYRNGIIQETDVMDAKSLPKVEMPNRNGFVPAVPVYPPDPTKPNWF